MFNPHSERFMAQLGELLPLTDLVLLDIKHMSDERHRKLTGHTNRQILSFARYLDEQGVPVWIRHVVVPGITLYREYLEELGTFMASLHNVRALDVLPYHTMGRAKYDSLGLPYPLEGTREAQRKRQQRPGRSSLKPTKGPEKIEDDSQSLVLNLEHH